jgi:hypothetical protein
VGSNPIFVIKQETALFSLEISDNVRYEFIIPVPEAEEYLPSKKKCSGGG